MNNSNNYKPKWVDYEQITRCLKPQDEVRIKNKRLINFFFCKKDLLERAPPVINIPRRSNIVQETLEDIIQQQATEIDRLRTELEREKARCLIAINEVEQTLRNREITWKSQLNEFELRSAELQKVRKEKLYYEQLLSSRQSPTVVDNLNQKLSQQLEQRERENAALNEEMRLLNLRFNLFVFI